ncbi:unnamed protein product [Soboliphyme baturini]|uniref:COesterase domain-containing protein n=1 Tax=Soboliphyme baturini TaxID=241478 RepID=A0A183IDQ0_9BILA|nr:unnamed protein product [Soboliphyme baturini]
MCNLCTSGYRRRILEEEHLHPSSDLKLASGNFTVHTPGSTARFAEHWAKLYFIRKYMPINNPEDVLNVVYKVHCRDYDKASELIDRLPEQPYNATFRKPWCIQFWYYDEHLENREQSEDCLYLNIFVPSQTKHALPFPVLVWIHGGSFQVGGSGMFPIRTTVKNLVSRGIVVVFVNYRLGPLGFLSSLSADLPGNYGLDDQVTALRWIKANIADFGELFHRIIARSGSALAPWAIRSVNTDLNSLHVIKLTSCLTDKRTANLSCLQHAPLSKFKTIWKTIAIDDLNLVLLKGEHEPMNNNHPFMAHTYFTPVVDSYRGSDSIIPTHSKELMKRNARLPIMTGITTGECIAYVSWLAYLGKMLYLIESAHP